MTKLQVFHNEIHKNETDNCVIYGGIKVFLFYEKLSKRNCPALMKKLGSRITPTYAILNKKDEEKYQIFK